MPRMTYIGLLYSYYVRVLQTKDSSLNRLQLGDLGDPAGSDVVEGTAQEMRDVDAPTESVGEPTGSDVVEGTYRQMRGHGQPALSDVEPSTDTSTYSSTYSNVIPVS